MLFQLPLPLSEGCILNKVRIAKYSAISFGFTAASTALHYRVDYRRGYLVNLGTTINLTCPYTAPFYKWTPASQTSWILSEDQTYSLKAESLAITGKYICRAVNGFGHNTAEFNIKVIGKHSLCCEKLGYKFSSCD